MPKQRKVKRINAFGGSIAKTKPELDDKIDVYPNPESSESINDKTPVGRGKRNLSAGRSSTSKSKSNFYTTLSAKRDRQDLAYDQNFPSAIKSPDKSCYTVPEIGPDEQLNVDTKSSDRISAGARVMALWKDNYYAAIICESNLFGRYSVVFVEDNFKRSIPLDAVIPISMLTSSTEVMLITNIDGKEMGKVIEIWKQPSKDDPKLWAEGLFEVKFYEAEESEKYEIESVSWSQIYLTKDQANVIHKTRARRSHIWQGNIVDRSTSIRRVRLSQSIVASQSSTNVPTPKTTPKRSRKTTEPQQNATRNIDGETNIDIPNKMQEEEEETQSLNPKTVSGLFTGFNFIFTTAPRSNKESDFNKQEIRILIEERGGQFVNDLKTLLDTGNTFLIADTYYRTEKYFLALSLSIPCVSYQWILDCVDANEFLPYENFMLPAGETNTPAPGRIYEWKPLKGTLLHGKKVMTYSKAVDPSPRSNQNCYSFVDIWSPIIENLGAVLIELPESGGPVSQKIEFIDSNKIDILVTDFNCEKEVAEEVESRGGYAVSCIWLTSTLISGELVDPNDSPAFCYDFCEDA